MEKEDLYFWALFLELVAIFIVVVKILVVLRGIVGA